jgi:hypothetical protein
LLPAAAVETAVFVQLILALAPVAAVFLWQQDH